MARYMTLESITREVDTMEKVAALNDEVLKTVADVNAAISTNDHQLIIDAKEAAKKAIDAFNTERQREIYAVIRNTSDPILTALTIGKIDAMKFSIKTTKSGEEANTSWVEETIDIVDIEDTFGGKISHNGQWRYWAEKLAKLFALATADEIGYGCKEVEHQYNISDEARKCDIGVTAVSTTNITKELQYVVDGLIFRDNGQGLNAYKVLKVDARYVAHAMTNRKKRMTITTGKGTFMRKLVTEIAHRIVTNGRYNLEYDQIKKN